MAADQALMDYIQNQIRKGYSLDYIREFLVSQGYNSSEVDESAEFISRQRQESIKNYINQEVKAGYNPDDIKQRLVSYGYSSEEVTKAMGSSNKKPNAAIIGVIAALVIIGAVLYFIASPGTDLLPDIDSKKMPGRSDHDLGVAPAIDIKPGSEKQVPVQPAPKETEFDRAEKVYEVINATQDQKIMQAVQMCENTENDIYRDACFDQLSKATRDHSLCLKITDLVQRDECFKRTAIYTRNLEICDSITDPVKRSQCKLYDYA